MRSHSRAATQMSQKTRQITLEDRVRARRSIQKIFAGLSFSSLIFALFVHHTPGFAALKPAELKALADAFLFLGTANMMTMWIWDWLFWSDIRT